MQKKYRALRFVVGLYRILAWVVLALGVLGAIAMVIAGAVQGSRGTPSTMMQNLPLMPVGMGLVGGLVAGLLTLVYAALLFIVLWAGSDFVMMLMDIEHNTRETVHYLRGELEAAPQRPEPTSWQQ